jgi:hypothetical protein
MAEFGTPATPSESREIRHRMFTIIDRTQINLSPLGIDQVLGGQIVTNPADRQALGELLRLIAEPSVSGLLVPAIQKIRSVDYRR